MTSLLLAVGVLVCAGVAALVLPRTAAPLATRIGAGGVVLAAVLGLPPALAALGGESSQLVLDWGAFGRLHLGLDALSGFFLLPVLGLSALAAVYGVDYLAPQAARRHIGLASFLFNALVASIVLVILARDALGFLLAWELMALSSFFLVAFENDQGAVREAGW